MPLSVSCRTVHTPGSAEVRKKNALSFAPLVVQEIVKGNLPDTPILRVTSCRVRHIIHVPVTFQLPLSP